MAPEEFDMVVIGAGICGIAAARFYLEIHPNCRLVILEKDTCPGGVWNARRNYDYFWTQSAIGIAEYADKPMTPLPEEKVFWSCFESKHLTEYLEEYIDYHKFAGKSLRERTRFGFKVARVEKLDGEWVISGQDSNNDTILINSPKLMVASGLSSSAVLPELPHRERFQGPIIHQEDFGESKILAAPNVKHVTVIGGGKSCADMVYAAIKAGKEVSWVIRTGGAGPGYFLPGDGMGPYKSALELGFTRLAASLSPSFFNPDTLWMRFLHGTKFGANLIHSAWNGIDKQMREYANYEGRTARKGFEKLSPDTPIFWQNGTGGLINRIDFWEVMAKAEIYRDDIVELDNSLIRLKSGEEIATDAILCGTGWTPSLEFFDQETRRKLGLPYDIENEPLEEKEMWAQLETKADVKVLKKFPGLANPPEYNKKPVKTTPYRLHNGIAPLRDNSIAFIGHVLITDYFRTSQAQAIWATAYFDKRLVLPAIEEQQGAIALFNAWCRRRYLTNGQIGLHFPFECTAYNDKILRELGLSSHRKGWFADFFAPCTSRDLVGLRDEYVAKYGRDMTISHEEAAGALST